MTNGNVFRVTPRASCQPSRVFAWRVSVKTSTDSNVHQEFEQHSLNNVCFPRQSAVMGVKGRVTPSLPPKNVRRLIPDFPPFRESQLYPLRVGSLQ